MDLQLNKWLTEASAANESVVYISLGSQVVWQQWYIDTFFEALNSLSKQIALRVVISLRSKTVKMPEDYDKQMYWVDEWLPQIEVLSHPAVKAGITHCGPGGAFEFVHCGVVPLCFPHYASE